jgi:protein-S-isoprenylcysteine O-methyltransferase Ste14
MFIFYSNEKRYNYLRHPSYFGWFYWSVGTQLLLGNPLCTIGYAVTGFLFFRHRITYEEEILQRQYPQQYPNYIDCTYIGIPWISSSKITPATSMPKNNISAATTKQKAT